MHYVYLLKDDRSKYYVGSTKNLKRRLDEHIDGEILSTKNCSNIELIWYSAFNAKQKALNFEKYLKSSLGHASRTRNLCNGKSIE